MTISQLTLRYLHQSTKQHFVYWITQSFFRLKQLTAYFIACSSVLLTLGALWLLFTHSVALVLALGAIAGSIVSLAYWFALPLLHPRRTQPDYTPDDLELANWEEVTFRASDGVELDGWFIPPAPSLNGATVVLVHGLGGNRGQLLSQAAVMAAHGYGAFLFDLRNHGKSRGTLTTLGYNEANDVCGAVDYLRTRPEVNPERIGLVGYSMGGAAVLHAAPRLPQIKAIVAESAYTSLEDNLTQGLIAKTGLPAFPFAPIMVWIGERLTGLRIHQVRPIDDVEHITCPVLFVHGTADNTVSASNSRMLYEVANEPKGLYMIKDAGHNGLLGADPAGFERYVLGFLDRSLREPAISDLPVGA